MPRLSMNWKVEGKRYYFNNEEASHIQAQEFEKKRTRFGVSNSLMEVG